MHIHVRNRLHTVLLHARYVCVCVVVVVVVVGVGGTGRLDNPSVDYKGGLLIENAMYSGFCAWHEFLNPGYSIVF